MFHCLDLLSQLGRCRKKELIFITFTTNSPEFCLIRKEKTEYTVNLCLSKQTKRKQRKKNNSRFCRCFFMITIKKTVFLTPSVP